MSSSSRARLFHLADVAAGHLRGNPCPNCGARGAARIIRKHFGVASIYRCAACALYFRPTGLTTEPRVARWYYSQVYGGHGFATELATDDRAAAIAWAQDAGKDRSALVARLLPLLPPHARRVGVLGASWGYELVTLERLGVEVYGIESGDARRESGRARLGLALYPTVAAAAAAGHRGGLVMSSHVLEHIPGLDATLDALDAALAPDVHLHLTPRVDPPLADFASSIGRDHPLGVTEAFWRARAARTGQALALAAHRPPSEREACETLALVARRDVADTPTLAALAAALTDPDGRNA